MTMQTNEANPPIVIKPDSHCVVTTASSHLHFAFDNNLQNSVLGLCAHVMYVRVLGTVCVCVCVCVCCVCVCVCVCVCILYLVAYGFVHLIKHKSPLKFL